MSNWNSPTLPISSHLPGALESSLEEDNPLSLLTLSAPCLRALAPERPLSTCLELSLPFLTPTSLSTGSWAHCSAAGIMSTPHKNLRAPKDDVCHLVHLCLLPGTVFTTPLLLLFFVTKSYLTLCDLMDCSPPGFSVHGILQARLPEG